MIDFEGFVDGKPFDGGKAEHYSLKLGSKSFIPGFEDALIGAAAGEERDVNVTFPTDYTPELAGKPDLQVQGPRGQGDHASRAGRRVCKGRF